MRDPYLYPDSDVLMNKLNIRNQSELDEAEADFVVFRLKEVAQNPLQANHIAGHFVVVIAESLSQRMTPDPFFNARLLCDIVHNLIHPLPGNRAFLVRVSVLFTALEYIFIALAAF